ncbi:nuclear pore complex protein Nup214 isoform X2 [Patella vulgata]|uniref:nuclear pore complex protein Nup214 isoform X2 n=1 Tax=Patella vulgata TaxID=6465 RepID=UPI0024A7F28F|nr:nuclear pore complex protein Nup214 isoform X2 [Patella vulgata]
MESRNATKITMFGKKKGDGAAPTLTYSSTSSQPSSYRGGFKKRGEEDRGFGGQSSEKKASTNVLGDTQSYVTTHQQTGVLFGATSSVGGASALSSSPVDASLIRPPKFTPSQTFDSTASSAQNFPSAAPTLTYSLTSSQPSSYRGGFKKRGEEDRGFGGQSSEKKASTNIFGDTQSYVTTHQQTGVLFGATSSVGGASALSSSPFDASLIRPPKFTPSQTFDSTASSAQNFPSAPSFGSGSGGNGRGGISGVSGQPTTGQNQQTAGGFGGPPKFSGSSAFGNLNQLEDFASLSLSQQKQQNFPPVHHHLAKHHHSMLVAEGGWEVEEVDL